MNNKKEFKDFYDLFGLPVDASEEEIKKRVRKLIKKYHPDKMDSVTQNQYSTILLAKDVLIDEEKREKYDELGHNEYIKNKNKSISYYTFKGRNSIYDTNNVNSEDVDELMQNNLNKLRESDVINKNKKSIKKEEYKYDNNADKSGLFGIFTNIVSILKHRYMKYIILCIILVLLFILTYTLLGIIPTIFVMLITGIFLFAVNKIFY